MNIGIIIGTVAGSVIGLVILAVIINILQKGGAYKGETQEAILGKKPGSASIEDLMKLSRSRFMQLFYASPCPDFHEMKGEYGARNHTGGILGRPANFFTDFFFGPGKWVGKSFFPGKGGYNVFIIKDKNGSEIIRRTRKLDTFTGPSIFDKKDSFHLNYMPYNGGIMHSMRDEIRKINDTLYIGLGHMLLNGGPINPMGFIVSGKPKQWMGPDA